MSLFSRIDRIRSGAGRGGDDREDDGVFAIPDLGKASTSAPPAAPVPAAKTESAPASIVAPVPVAPPTPVEAVASAPVAPTAPVAATGMPAMAASATATPPTGAPDAPPKRLSPLERLARRTAELEDDGDGALPDPVLPDRPSVGNLLERLKAEPLPDVVALETHDNGSPIPSATSTEDDEANDDGEVPIPPTPFRRPALFDQQSQGEDATSSFPDDEPLPDTVTPESGSEADTTDAPDPIARLAREEESPFAAVTLPPREAPPEEAPAPIPSPVPASGGTAFDRLMAARAGASTGAAPSASPAAEAPRSSTLSLAERLSAMRANAEAAAQTQENTPFDSPSTASETAPAVAAASEPEPQVVYDPDTRLEDVLPPIPEPEEIETSPTEFEAQVETQEQQSPLAAEASPAIPLPASGLDLPEPALLDETSVSPSIIEEPVALVVPEALPAEVEPEIEEEAQEVAAPASSTPPPPFMPVEIPPAPAPAPPVAQIPMPSRAEEPAPVAPPLPWETVAETPAPAPVEVPAPTASSLMWAQRLAGRDALRDSAIPPAPRVPAEQPASALQGPPTEALERAAGALARTGGEGAASESEARNRALYRQKHFMFDAVLGSLDGRALQHPTREGVKPIIERAVDAAVREFNLSLDNSDRAWMNEEFIREVIDLGPLVGLLDDVSVNKILVVGSTDVAVERLGRIERTGVSFRDDDHLLSVVRRIADLTGGRIDAKVPLLDRPLPDGARIRAKIPPLAPQPTLTVEKSTGNPFTALKRQQADRGRENALPYSQLRERIQQRLLREFEGNAAALSNPERLRGQVEEMIGLVIAEEKVVVSRAERASLVMDLLNEIVGLGPIEPLLNDPEVDEVMVNGPFQIYVERKGKLEIAPQRFRDNNHVMQVIERIVAPLGRRVDEKSPMVDGRLRDGSRFNAIIPPLALSGPTMTIRKFARDPLTMTDLINFGSLSREAAQFLQAAVEGKMNIIVSGGTGSGKTTTLNVLSSFIPSSDRIVTIEDAAELQLRQEHVVRLETRPSNIEGAGEITIRDLVRNSLRMRPDRIVIGECRGGEALDMLQAMNTGHDGSLTTAHSNGPRDTVKRLETMVMMAGFDLPIRAIREQISMAIQFVVHQERMRDGKRRVTAITELVGMEGDVVTMQDIFRFEQDRVDDEGRIVGTLAATGLRPQNFDNIVDHGVNLSMDLFQPRSMGGRDGDLRSRLSEHRIGTR